MDAWHGGGGGHPHYRYVSIVQDFKMLVVALSISCAPLSIYMIRTTKPSIMRLLVHLKYKFLKQIILTHST